MEIENERCGYVICISGEGYQELLKSIEQSVLTLEKFQHLPPSKRALPLYRGILEDLRSADLIPPGHFARIDFAVYDD